MFKYGDTVTTNLKDVYYVDDFIDASQVLLLLEARINNHTGIVLWKARFTNKFNDVLWIVEHENELDFTKKLAIYESDELEIKRNNLLKWLAKTKK